MVVEAGHQNAAVGGIVVCLRVIRQEKLTMARSINVIQPKGGGEITVPLELLKHAALHRVRHLVCLA